MFPSSNSKDYCFSGKRCMVQLLQGMIMITEELNSDNLAERIIKAKIALKKEIELLKTNRIIKNK